MLALFNRCSDNFNRRYSGLDDISCHFKEKGQKLDEDVFSGQNYAEKDLLRMYCRFCGYKWNEDTREEKFKKQLNDLFKFKE
jgi:hypothetical protein